jgi:hypothetical protein
VLSGGLTLGGGLLAGGLIGALGAAGLARCVNLVRGTDRSYVAWNAEALDQLTEAAVLRYLAVAHFGRGRGEWSQGESPAHWRDVVQRALAPHREALADIWRERDAPGDARRAADDSSGEAARDDGESDDSSSSRAMIAAALAPIVAATTADVLRELYPSATALRENAQPALPPSQ